MGMERLMNCPVLNNLHIRRDLAKAAHPDELLSAAEMHWAWEIEDHASHGHDGKPCPGDFAQMYNRGR